MLHLAQRMAASSLIWSQADASVQRPVFICKTSTTPGIILSGPVSELTDLLATTAAHQIVLFLKTEPQTVLASLDTL